MINPNILLRIGGGLCFIGHGALALSGSEKFVELLTVAGLGKESALPLLIGIGSLDILVGLLLLFKPSRSVLVWATCWTALTLIAWGMYGDSWMDLLRRATYFTTPLALLYLIRASEKNSKQAFPEAEQPALTQEQAIEALDLNMICMKLMDHEEGEGWSEEQCTEAAKEYRRYLLLNLRYPTATIVPNRAIDTLWHYHILDTAAYARDCQAIFGHLLHHYPYFGMDGVKGERQLVSAFDRTKVLYEETFSEPMSGPNYLPSFQRAS